MIALMQHERIPIVNIRRPQTRFRPPTIKSPARRNTTGFQEACRIPHARVRLRSFYLPIYIGVTCSLAILLVGCSPNHRPNEQAVDTVDAAIVDQLALYQPNSQFIQNSTQELETQGFKVDVYSGKEVTLDLYRNLPTKGYEMIIFRAHSGFLGEGSGSEVTGPTYLFTGEDYAVTKSSFGQLFDQVSPAQAFDGPTVFAVNPEFVLKGMKGDFRNTAIIMMGCATARNADMAQAFIDKGASVYIGWSASVCLDYVDKATENMVEELIVNRTPVELALSQTVAKVGLDPEYNASPKYYPSQAGSKTIYELTKG